MMCHFLLSLLFGESKQVIYPGKKQAPALGLLKLGIESSDKLQLGSQVQATAFHGLLHAIQHI